MTRSVPARLPLLPVFLLLLAAHGAGAQSLEWRFVTGGRLRLPPAVGHDGVIYAASDERRLYALTPPGRQRWSARLEALPVTAPLLGWDGSVYLGLEGGLLAAFDAGGRPRWRAVLPAGLAAPGAAPASGRDGTLYLPLRGGLLLALDPFGRERWRFQGRAEFSGGVSVGRDGTLYLGSADRRLLALEPGGALKWETPLPGAPGTPAIAASAAAGSGDTLYVPAFGLHAVSARGDRLWSYAIADEVGDPLIGPGGVVLAGTRSGRLVALDPSGRRLWERLLEGQPRPAVTAGGTILAAAADTLTALDPAGEVLGTVRLRREAAPPVPGPAAGEAYAGSLDWDLYGLRLPAGAAGAEAGSAWPQAGHDGHHTGRAGALDDLESPDYRALRELAAWPAEEAKLRAVRELGRTVGGGDRTGLLHVSLLEGLAGGLLAEGVTVRQREAGRPVADFPAVRRQACRLLGEAGTATAARLLAGALRADPDLTVRAAAARELGRAAAAPPAGLVPLLLAELEAHPREGGYARELLAALTAALRGEPGPPDPDDLRALLRLSQGGLPRETRRVLGELLRELARRPPAAGP